MARPLRLDYPGATHHVFVRGVARSTLAVDAADYERALALLEQAALRFELRCHAWCYLPNHSHLLVTSHLGNLSRAMHWLGTCTAQTFNKRYERAGHLYQGRFGSRLVEDDDYLLELARYVPLNPVRAALCETPEDWPWSSYAATAGLARNPGSCTPEHFSTHSARPTRMPTGSQTESYPPASMSMAFRVPRRARRSRRFWPSPPTARSQAHIFATATPRPRSQGTSA